MLLEMRIVRSKMKVVQIEINYKEVKEYVRDVIVKEKRSASMKLLHDIYRLGIGKLSYRHNLKTRLQKDFDKDIPFLSENKNTKTLTESVISSGYLNAETVLHSNDETLKIAAMILRNDTLKKFES